MADPPIELPMNLFLAHSPFQYFIASHMVASMTEFGASGNYLIVDCRLSEPDRDHKGWREVLVLDPPLGPSVVGAGRRMRQILKRVGETIGDHAEVRLFITNLQWPLNNAMGAALTRGSSGKRVVLCNYPEGTGSLRLVYPDRQQRCRDLLKCALSLVGGVGYRPIDGDLMGLEACDRIYSLLPHLLPTPLQKKAVNIPSFPLQRTTTAQDTCIFLGQNDRLLPRHRRGPVAVEAAAYCRRLPYRRFLYKSHHYGQSTVQREAFLGAGFEPMNDSRPVEQIMMNDMVACVASFNSSALIHLKMMYGGRIRCIACLPDEFGKMTGMAEASDQSIRRLFEQTGVEIFAGPDSNKPGEKAGAP